MDNLGTEANDNVQSEGNKPNDKAQSKDNKTNDKEDLEFEIWVDSTRTMLGCVGDKRIEPCSISIIPKHLRESNKDAFTPTVVSIGPLHKRTTNMDLLYMEEMKLRCMVSLFHRTKDPKASLTKCSKAMYNLDEVIRASYIHDLNSINIYDLAKIMLLDGCFLLELLIDNDKELNNKLKSSFNPGTKVKKEDVLFDLIVLENQIPLIVLDELLTTLFPNDFTMEDGKKKEDSSEKTQDDGEKKEGGSHEKKEEDSEKRQEDGEIKEGSSQKKKENCRKVVNRLALSLFVHSLDGKINSGFQAAGHLLELLHSFITKKLEEQAAETEDNHSSCTIDVDSIVVKKSREKLELKRCATKLEAAGVKIKIPKRPHMENLKQTCLKYGKTSKQ